MSSEHPSAGKKRRLPTVRVGLAVGATGLGLAGPAHAEPVPTPLVAAPPAGDAPAWTAAPVPFPSAPAEVRHAALQIPAAAPDAVKPPADWPKLPAAEPLAPPRPVEPLPRPAPEPIVVPAPDPDPLDRFTEPPPDAPLAPPSDADFPLPGSPAPSTLSATGVQPAPPPREADAMLPKLTSVKSALVGAALAAGNAPVAAQPPADKTQDAQPDAATLRAKLDAALKRLDDSEARVKDLEGKLKKQEERVLALSVSVDGIEAMPGLVRKFEDLKAKFDTLQTDYAKLAARVNPDANSTSAKPEAGPQPMPSTPGTVVPKADNPPTRTSDRPTEVVGTTGTLQIVNQYATPVTVVINGVSHKVEPNTTKRVTVTAPEFEYQLIGTGGPTKQAIKPNEMLDLTISN